LSSFADDSPPAGVPAARGERGGLESGVPVARGERREVESGELARVARKGVERARGYRRDLLCLVVLFALSLPLVTTRIYASDEVQYFSYLRSLWFDHDLSFENEYRHFYDSGVTRYPGFHETFLERRTETGRRVNFGTIGAPLLWSPFYAVADVITRVRRSLGTEVSADGFSQPYIAAVAYASAFYGWLALVLGYFAARTLLVDRRFISRPGRPDQPPLTSGLALAKAEGLHHTRLDGEVDHQRHVLWATLAVWVGTPLVFYMYVAPPMAHACSSFAVALFLVTWMRVRRRWSFAGCAALGALAALMAMVREQDALIAVGPIADLGWTLFKGFGHQTRTRLIVGAFGGAAAFVLAYLPQLAAYVVLNGYPGPSRLVARKMNWMAPHMLGVLASPGHGLLFWTPLVVLALVGLVLAARHGVARERNAAGAAASPARDVFPIWLLLIVAGQAYVAGSVESWTVAGAFGQRRFVGLSALFVIGLAFAWAFATTRARRAVLAVLVALCVWWNLGLMAQFGAGLMDRQRLQLTLNARQTFVTIPHRLPELVWRYVVDRRSFYRSSATGDVPAAESQPR
jgi:hypothetical protein